jgi:pyruvate dehydrogenase E1 component
MVEHLTDEEIRNLPRGGHDYRKLYAAYKAAIEQEGAPTVILAKTVKGWTLGPDVEGRNATHQIKKMTTEQLRLLRTRLHLEDMVPESALEDGVEPPYISLDPASEAAQYLQQRRRALDGPLPVRSTAPRRPIELPADSAFDEVLGGSGKHAASTTTAFTRLLRNLCRDERFGPRVVPIVPDEARTFGMDSMFRELGIYASKGQQYEPVDHDLLLSYKESQSGQILEEGITEAGSMASFIAAGTSYATQGVPMVPFFTFYSMFGFQRVGDLIWQATDARARGFLLGATAGRTTLLGEGLQHQDGHSLLLASVNPAIEAYDPAFAYEVAAIVRHGLQRMWVDGDDVIYDLALYNENHLMPAIPEGAADGVVEGLYPWAAAPAGLAQAASVLFSGTANLAAREAQAELAEHYGIGVDLWSATSYKRLREQALATERRSRLHPDEAAGVARVTELLADGAGPVVAVTDFLKAVPDQVARWIPEGRRFTPLGTDGFGRSDTREALRRHFETDAGHVVVAVLSGLVADGACEASVVKDALDRYDIDADAADPASIDLG